jgi:hypothetical protein
MSQKDENIKASCTAIAEYLRRIKNELSAHKKLPVELFITVNTAHRAISKETQKIRRAVWRKKTFRPANIKPMIYTYSLSNGESNVYR